MTTRRELRARERAHRALVRDLERLARLQAGGAPERPIDVGSSAVIEPMAARMKCPLCEGTIRVDSHDASHDASASHRAVRVRCTRCATPRTLYFRLAPPWGH